MGMAASQARYLALVARKSNCEYEGQQINQARTALSNQSANLFNQMLGLSVPVPPSTQDFTKTQYSFKDGVNASTISSWQQLSEADPDYNYVVTHYYYTDRYTGSMKKLSDPQVQFGSDSATLAEIANARSVIAKAKEELDEALKVQESAKEEYLNAIEALNETKNKAIDLNTYNNPITTVSKCTYKSETDEYNITHIKQPLSIYTYTTYDKLASQDSITAADNLVKNLVEIGALNPTYLEDKSGLYFLDDGSNFIFQTDLAELFIQSTSSNNDIDPPATINRYFDNKTDDYSTQTDILESILAQAEVAYNTANDNVKNAQEAYEAALEAYADLGHPSYIGNCELTPLGDLTEDQKAEIEQVIADMIDQGIDANISKCFDEDGNYLGGIYSFQLNGTTYYTTYQDLENSYASGTGNNNIDGQVKMAYYNATYVSTKIEETEKALLETDENGRFVSVRFEDDTIKYTLNMESVTDEVAYKDAMNQYYYENAKYDKMIQDINARTSIIQQEDQQLELRLKQLDTEQSALSTEMEAVKKVVDDNVESSFKTFGG